MAQKKAMTKKMLGCIWKRVSNKFHKNSWVSTRGNSVAISEVRSGFWEVYFNYGWYEFKGKGAERKAFSLAKELITERIQ